MHLLRPGEELGDLLTPYAAVDRCRPGRAWVMANMVGTLSGSAAVGGKVGELSEGPDARLFVDMRSLADVVLVGAETVRREGYGPVRLREELVAARRDQGRPDSPVVAVVSRSLELDWDRPVFADAPEGRRTIVLTCESADPARLARAREVADVVVAGERSVDPALAVAALSERGHGVVLCEGGPRWLGELVAHDCLDELCLTVAPILGGDLLPVSIAPPDSPLRRFALRHAIAADDTLFLRYERPADA
ncbi:pyrimidine reductase family protein [Nocardioides sp. dk4132]|uniref:pyrimidine reductase family protein n=1 Tax=unclassified Nocardioides TaxID=2615069 RepID=UPI001296A0BD|nr:MULTISPECIES: pyrimidine reductase family protein [unclassified Nocardioides]MQW75715.1 pyrimidine reductase family protein [Nocardioides sp. dk4132]QGA08602.1 pyrimidine reductase family protein [Nocardioides sp. dk884]